MNNVKISLLILLQVTDFKILSWSQRYKEKDKDGIQEWVLLQHHPKLGDCDVVEQTIDKVFL